MAKPLSVLIVGDAESDTRLILRQLKKGGYKPAFEQVRTPTQMRKALKKQEWEIVISACALLKLDAFTALKILQESGLDIPFLVVADRLGEETEVEIFKAGASDCVLKGNLKLLAPMVERELAHAADHRECKRLQDALSESDLFQKAIVDSTFDLIWSVDPVRFGLTKYNRGLEDYFSEQRGIQIKVGDRPEELFPPGKNVKHWHALYRRALKEGPFTTEYLVFSGTRTLELNFNLIMRENKVRGITVFGKDITERKQIEDNLRENENRYQLIFENSGTANTIFNTDCRVILQNSMSKDFTLSRNALGKTALEIFGPEQGPLITARMQRVLTTRVPEVFETLFPNQAGGRWIRSNYLPLLKEQHELVGIQVISQDITERKQAEEELQTTEKRYRELTEFLPISIFEIDAGGNLVSFNKTALDVFRYSREDFHEGLNALQFFSSEEAQRVGENIQKVLQGTSLPGQEYNFRRKDGSTFHGLLFSSPRILENKPMGIRGAIIDITERKLADEKLRENEERFRSLYENATIGMYRTSPEGRILMANPALITMLGYKSFKALSRRDLTSEGYEPGYPRLEFQDHIERNGEVIGLESAWKRRDGSSIFVRESARLVRDENNQPLYYEGTVEDITERKQAEEALKQSEEKFRVSFMTGMDAFYWSTLEDGKIIEVNPVFEEVWGYTREEAIGRTSLQLGLYQDPGDRVKMISGLKEKGLVKDMELKGKRKDGKSITISLSGSVMMIDNQSYILGVIRDVTEKKQVEQQREILYQVLRAVSGQLEPELIARSAVNTIVRLTGYPHVCIALPDENGTHWVVRGAAGRLAAELGATYPIHKGVIGNAFKTGQTQWVRDVMKDPHYVNDVKAPGGPALRSEFVALMRRGVDLLGALNVESDHADAFTEADVWMIQSAADIVSLALQNARLYREAQQEIAERKQAQTLQEAIYRIATAAETTKSLEDLYPQIHQIISSVMPAENFYITLYDEAQNMLRFPYFKDAEDEPFMGGIQPARGLGAYVLRTGKSLLCTQAVHDELERLGEVKLLGVASAIWLGVPLIVEGKTIGAMVVQHYTDPKAYGEREQHMLEFVSSQVGIVITRKQAEEALRQSEAELRALFASMRDLVMVIDRVGIYRKIAPTNPALLMKPPEELIGKPLQDVFPPDQANLFVNILQKVMDTDQPAQIEYELPIGNRTVPFETSILPLNEDSTLWVARDITARKQVEEEMRRLNAELESRVEERTRELRLAQEKIVRQEKLALLGQLAGGVGHELRNPLGIISNAIYYLKIIQPNVDEKVKQYHAMIEQEVHNSEKIITDLLDFARLESMDKEPVVVSELVQRTLARFPVPVAIQTTLNLNEDLPKVFVDLRQMEQVLGNLTVNACQAMLSPRGTTPLRPTAGGLNRGELTISAVNRNGMVEIAVTDTGTGITPENMNKLFEPLFTTKSKGIGLGLAVSKKLVEANGGRIEVKSKPGMGSTFTLVLPVEGK